MKFRPDLKRLKPEVLIETYRSRGPGGQRKNKTETSVRMTHLPSGITVVATEHRSQAENRKLAWERLQKRLIVLSRPKRRRIRTVAPPEAIDRRLEEKRTLSMKKAHRRKPSEEE